MRPGFSGLDDGRVTLIGNLLPLPEEQKAAAREAYLARLPDSFWVDFGDFAPYKLDLSVGRYNGGFGKAANLSAEQFLEADADPVAQFSTPVSKHMNDDHMEANIAMVKLVAGLTVQTANMVSIDSLGVNMQVKHANGEALSVRIPFRSPAPDRKSVKDRIVELTKEAQAAATA